MPHLDDTGPGQDLRSYAPIGDGRTIALIGLRGQIDWMPIPGIDDLPIFGRLLDDDAGGCIELEPVEEYEVRRRYLPRTNVLVTTFMTASGKATVTDALVTGVAGRLPWAELARRVDGVEGEVAFRWRVQPGTSLKTAAPWHDRANERSILRSGLTTIGVTGRDYGPEPAASSDGIATGLAGGFTTSQGSRHLLIVVGTHDEPIHFPNPDNVDRGIDRTIEAWRAWSREFSYDGPWANDVQRSALMLKMLIHSPTGAIAAAATTSLPEDLTGGKNWDYRLAWVRDLAYTVDALIGFGLREETHAAISWLLRTIRRHGPELHVMYTLDGELDGHVTTYDVPGWRGVGPVVTGNPAREQVQLGVYGDLFAICRAYVEAGNALDVETGRMLSMYADKVCDSWRNPDSGMWELPEERHYTSSKMGCWQALNDAVALAELGQIPGSSERWAAEAALVRTWVDEHGWSESRGAYVMAQGSRDLDASVLLHSLSGFDRGERMSRTIDALTGELGEGPHLFRYTGMRDEEATFVACSFWRAAALVCVGRHDEGIAAMNELVAAGNDVGMYAEMIDPEDGAFLGNLPQALSHLALIRAALTIRDLVGDDADGR
ncbi:Glucoamylase (glucan-1,4-alpha-glucosidase), GH15 family [Microbacterium sp. LKL04]|uniref:glycoside hydrolase family 15 protein n=1 Tax=Microbacterium sp. LKL04 TaxID=912630 RepID=UPI000875CE60|nr:glycoside hydrolase family 15 protein [Microbacterium sp. LKL04]SCY02651.1 Glucoamylase (glucan-1,4-alpha-glucosidase), GH15 family [Microbacterium sp. LKL04]